MKRLVMVIFVVVGSCFAEETNQASLRMPEVVVTATRSETPAFDLPYATQSLSRDVIQDEQMSRTLPEALREIPSVMIQKTAYGQGSPYIRGFTGFRTLMLVDGIRLNNSTFRDGPNQYWSTVDPFSLQRLEVVKGPGSVLYGSDAIGGTVNAITLDAPDTLAARTCYRFASAEDSHIGRGEAGTGNQQVGITVGATYKAFGDLNDQPKTGYDEWNVDTKAEYRFHPDSKLVLGYQHASQNDVWRTHRTIYGIPWEGTTIGTDKQLSYDQWRDLVYLQYRALKLSPLLESLTVSVSFQQQDELLWRIKNNNTQQKQGVNVGTPGFWVQAQTPGPLGTWTCGLEYYHDIVDSYGYNYNAVGTLTSTDIQGPVADDASYDLFGAFVQDEIPLNSRLKFIVGGRYTFAGVDANKVRNPVTGGVMSLSDSWNSVVGSGRFIYQLDKQDRWHLFAGVSQGFRAPNLSDLTRLDIARSGEIETAAPGLRPEQFVTGEIGLKTRHDRFSAELAYYYTDIHDMIIRAPTGNIVLGALEVTKRNAGNGYLHGVELSGRYEFAPQWSAFGWFSWMDGEVDSYPTSAPLTERKPLSRLMPASGQIGLRWEQPKPRLWIEAVCLMAAAQHELSPDDERDTQRIPPGGTPGYGVFTVRGGWQINKYASLSVALENLLDKDYRIHGSGINEPGRNFILTADLRF